MYDENADNEIDIGYYPIRAKGQICRLLCEFLQIKYKDQLFTPDSWKKLQ
jgi:hypothetical protein